MTVKLIFGGMDDTPDAFSFTASTGVNPSTANVTSNSPTITGINGGIPVSITAGTGSFSINGGAYVTSGFILNGQTLTARQTTASAAFNTTTGLTIKVGQVSATYNVTTRVIDSTPTTPMTGFGSVSGADPSIIYTSGVITITGLEPSNSFSLSNSSVYAWAAAAYNTTPTSFTSPSAFTTDAAGRFNLRVQLASSGSLSATTNGRMYVSGVLTDYFSITTRDADLTPGTGSFSDVMAAERNTLTYSNTITVGGLEPGMWHSVTASGVGEVLGSSGTWNGGSAWADGAGNITLQCRATSSSLFSTATAGTNVYVNGTFIDTWYVTTRDADFNGAWLAGASGTWSNVTGAAKNTTYTAGQIGANGFEPNYLIGATSSGGNVALADPDTGAWSGYSTSVNRETDGAGGIWVNAQVTTGNSGGTAYTVTVWLGYNLSQTYTVTTAPDNVPQANYNGSDATGNDYASPWSSDASVTFQTDGSVTYYGWPNNVSSAPTSYSSNGSAGTSGWYVKAVLSSGSTPGGTLNTWLALSSARSWTVSRTIAGQTQSVIYVTVNTSASDSGAVGGYITLTAENVL